MVKKVVVFMIHAITNVIIQIAIILYTLYFPFYSFTNLFMAFFAGVALVLIDYCITKKIINKSDFTREKPRCIHCSDLILAVLPLLLLINSIVSATRHGTGHIASVRIALLVAVLVVDAGVFTERVILYKGNT